SRSRLTSRMVTFAPSPAATLAALAPTTPPPRMTTFAGSTPGTPPSKMPRPSNGRSRNFAPSWMLIRPATSLIGVSSASPPRPSPAVVADGRVGDGRDARSHHGSRQGLVGGEVEVGEDELPRPQQRPLFLQRLLDLDPQVGPAPDRWRVRDDVGAVGRVLLVADAAALAGARLDEDRVAAA